jgi:hypothetical protein
MVFSLVTCVAGRSWQAERSWYDDEFSALSGESSRDRLQTGVSDLKHTLGCSLASDLHNDLIFTCIHAIRDKVAGM